MAKLGDYISPAKNIKCGDGNYPVLSMTMHDGIVLQSERFKKNLASSDQSGYKVVAYGQLVVGFPIDEGVLYLQRTIAQGIMSPAYNVWDVDYSCVDPSYFELSLHSPQAMQYYKENLRGSTARRRSLPKEVLLELPLKMPAIDEQKRIAATIENLTHLIDTRRKQIDKIDELVKSRFVEMFGDPVSNPKEWDVVKIGDIATEVKYGTSLPAVEGGKYPYLRMNNMTHDGHLDLSNLKYIDVPDDEIEKCIVRKGDVLFNRTNSVELVGKTCVFDLDEEMIIAGYIIRVRLHEAMLPIVFSSYMNTVVIKQYLRKIAKGAVNQANINAKELQAIQIYLPPLDLQNQFADFVAQVDKSKLAVQKSLEQLEILKKSLMQAYFG